MKFTLTWKPSALNDLATLWLDAPSGQQETIRQVVDDIETALIRNPLNVGESRDEFVRMVVERPIAILFEVSP